jgi:glycerol-3-phosphate dehydrogenase
VAEETVDAIAKHIGRNTAKCQTAESPLLDAKTVGNTSGILPPPVSAVLVKHFCSNEWARHLDDVMIRRTSWRHYHANQMEIATRVAEWMAHELGWDEQATQSEIARYREKIGENGAVTPHAFGNGFGNGTSHSQEVSTAAMEPSTKLGA